MSWMIQALIWAFPAGLLIWVLYTLLRWDAMRTLGKKDTK